MTYPMPTDAQVSFYREHGWLTVQNVIPKRDLNELRERCQIMTTRPDFAMNIGALTPRNSDTPPDHVWMSMLEMVWLDWKAAAFHQWTTRFAAALTQTSVQLWYNQLYYKPPLIGAPTHWHQDAAYLGEVNQDLLISCWLALADVDTSGGCMQFLDRGHRLGIIKELKSPDGYYGSRDWTPPEGYRVERCPLKAGGMTFHHGKTPHMTEGNRGDSWREVVIQRFTLEGASQLCSDLHAS